MEKENKLEYEKVSETEIKVSEIVPETKIEKIYDIKEIEKKITLLAEEIKSETERIETHCNAMKNNLKPKQEELEKWLILKKEADKLEIKPIK